MRKRNSRSRALLGLSTVLTLVLLPAAAGAAGDPESPWLAGLRAVEAALARSDVSAAVWAWHDARTAALDSARWEGMLAVGEASLLIGHAAHTRLAAEADAKDAYLVALYRARRQNSFEGVLRALEAFAALGDREMVTRCVTIAEALLGKVSDSRFRQEARARIERSVSHLRAAERPDRDGP